MSFEEIDANGDSVITADEFVGPPEAFERIDADGDGQITAEELSSARPPERPAEGQ
jgi:Ca2+-binding EF-hand superfamily protein